MSKDKKPKVTDEEVTDEEVVKETTRLVTQLDWQPKHLTDKVQLAIDAELNKGLGRLEEEK